VLVLIHVRYKSKKHNHHLGNQWVIQVAGVISLSALMTE